MEKILGAEPAVSSVGQWVNRRYEKKIVLKQNSYVWHRIQLRLSEKGFCEHYSPRFINSLYFEDPLLSSFNSHLYEHMTRQKYRLRWYGTLYGTHKAILEIKTRHGDVGWKERIAPDKALKFDGTSESISRLTEMSNRMLWSYMIKNGRSFAPIIPFVITRYRRKYFRSATGDARITIDEDIYHAIVRGAFKAALHLSRQDIMLIEIKYGTRDEHLVSGIFDNTGIFISRNSKFMAAALQILKF